MNITKDDVRKRVWSFLHGWGTIQRLYYNEKEIQIRFDTRGLRFDYFSDGRFINANSQVLFWDEIKFEIPPKPKNKIKKQISAWANIYSNKNSPLSLFETRAIADRWGGIARIACVELKGEYEVEGE